MDKKYTRSKISCFVYYKWLLTRLRDSVPFEAFSGLNKTEPREEVFNFWDLIFNIYSVFPLHRVNISHCAFTDWKCSQFFFGNSGDFHIFKEKIFCNTHMTIFQFGLFMKRVPTFKVLKQMTWGPWVLSQASAYYFFMQN